jgi:VanZ like family
VILPHDFFAWIASHLFTTKTSYRAFAIFWGSSWFAIVKGWHAAEFAILFTLARALLDRVAGVSSGRALALALAFCLLYAISDEYHQTFVPGRGGTWVDVAIDTLGASAAASRAWIRHRRGPSHTAD